ncbi:hypothetical protein niasHT_019369 [Heterodera trifolii]|uniref:Uncharacterized protein n=1 Tax=Heterodera trifolii TaxID=157864 RepID=A0ABD2L5T2_9BILA
MVISLLQIKKLCPVCRGEVNKQDHIVTDDSQQQNNNGEDTEEDLDYDSELEEPDDTDSSFGELDESIEQFLLNQSLEQLSNEDQSSSSDSEASLERF